MNIRRIVVGIGIPALAAAALAACGGTGAASTGSKAAAKQPAVAQSFSVEVLNGERAKTRGLLGPDGRGHDMFVPSALTVKAGAEVTLRFVNYDEGPHTFTITELGISKVIAPHVDDTTPSVTTFTITFPKAGTYRYFCALPCDGGQGHWAMGLNASGEQDQDGFMAGTVTVTA